MNSTTAVVTPGIADSQQHRKHDNRPRPPRGGEGSASRPVMEIEVKVSSQPAKKVYERTFRYAAINCYAIDRITSIVLGPEAYHEAVGTVNKWFDDYRTALAEETVRVEKIREQMGIQSQIKTYSNPQVYRAEVSTPLAIKYLKLIELLDAFVRLVDTLWLHGAFDDTHKVEIRTYSWQQRLIKVGGHIRQLAQELRRRIKQKGVEVPNEVRDLISAETPAHDEEPGAPGLADDTDRATIVASTETPAGDTKRRGKTKAETARSGQRQVATG